MSWYFPEKNTTNVTDVHLLALTINIAGQGAPTVALAGVHPAVPVSSADHGGQDALGRVGVQTPAPRLAHNRHRGGPQTLGGQISVVWNMPRENIHWQKIDSNPCSRVLLTQQFSPSWDDTRGPVLDPGPWAGQTHRGHAVREHHPGPASLPPDLDHSQIVAEGPLVSEKGNVRGWLGAGYLLVAGVNCHALNLKSHLLGINLVKVVLANHDPHLSWISSPAKNDQSELQQLMQNGFYSSRRGFTSNLAWLKVDFFCLFHQ